MHGHADSAATADHPRRNGRVEAAREQRDNLARGAYGKTTRATLRGGVRVHVDVGLNDVDVHRDIGLVHLNAEIREGFAQGGSNLAVEVDAVDGVIRVGATTVNLERLAALAGAKALDGRGVVLLRVAGTAPRDGNASDTRHGGHHAGDVLGHATVFEAHANVPREALDMSRTPLEGTLEVGDELALKDRTVLTLETNLVIMNEADAISHGATRQS